MAAQIFVGTSGWNYKHWSNGVFYPQGMSQSSWLNYYSQYFGTVEINSTFYRLPEKRVFEEWYRKTPEDFTFAVKASRFITHMKKLLNTDEHIARFLENATGLREKMGVVLFQLPPHWGFDLERLEGLVSFIDQQKIVPGIRSALELRDRSWYCEACFEVLRRHNVSLVLADWPGFNVEGPLTGSFVFIRRHGPQSLYASDYPQAALQSDAQRICHWVLQGKDVYIYFNNDAYGYAVRNALYLKSLIGRGQEVY